MICVTKVAGAQAQTPTMYLSTTAGGGLGGAVGAPGDGDGRPGPLSVARRSPAAAPSSSEVCYGAVETTAGRAESNLRRQQMATISRRMFMKRTGAGAAATGFLAAIPQLPGRLLASRKAAAVHSDGVAAPRGRGATGPLIVHVPDPRTGEVHVMVGSREVIRTDHALAARLIGEAG